MVKTSVLNDALNSINNAEKSGKRQVLIHPSSKVIVKFLSVMQKHGYIGEFEEVDDHRSGKIVIQLNGRLNKTGVISPRFTSASATLRSGLSSSCLPVNLDTWS
ncbi:40S ribosomal protein S22 [Lachnellula subtilissima]|uniref:40S ribosomal protein S22 n=1 Tax=Lachnellula subtilissima TaxID=602034 RepID=A0A8H8RDR5_9HELO|nr:40S ribosomal protein S22 [Lachnellula subtilissima]